MDTLVLDILPDLNQEQLNLLDRPPKHPGEHCYAEAINATAKVFFCPDA